MAKGHRQYLVRTENGYEWWDERPVYPVSSSNGAPMGTNVWSRPLVSQSLSCHSDQVEQFRNLAAPGIEYADDGTCRIYSRSARAEEFKRRGLIDRDAGYADHPGG